MIEELDPPDQAEMCQLVKHLPRERLDSRLIGQLDYQMIHIVALDHMNYWELELVDQVVMGHQEDHRQEDRLRDHRKGRQMEEMVMGVAMNQCTRVMLLLEVGWSMLLSPTCLVLVD